MSNTNQTLCTCGCCEEGSGHTPLNVENAPGLSELQYRIGTHSSFKQTMLREIAKKQALSKLTTRDNDDLAIATMDAWATVLDVLSFYQERIINEGFLRTSTERLSVLELARHISYKLAPGVASGTFLAFTMNEAPGNPVKVTIPEGTKVQSIPGQDETPQVFETIEDFEARVEWNAMAVQISKKRFPKSGDKKIYLQGVSTGLLPGDAILIVGDEEKNDITKERWDFRRIKEVLPDNDAGYTKLTWERVLGKKSNGSSYVPAKENVKVYAMKQKAFLFGYNAPDFRAITDSVKSEFMEGGLKGEYFSDMSFGTKVFNRTDNTINFNWGAGAPSGMPVTDNFSIRWTGYVKAPVTGTVTFFTSSDDGVRLWVDGQLIINNFTEHEETENSFSLSLTSGELYKIRLDYFEKTGSAVIKLSWDYSGISKKIIPADYLFQPDEDWPGFTVSQIAGATGTVCLDNLYPKIMKENWLVLTRSGAEEIYIVTSSEESSRNDFTLASKTSVLELDGERLVTAFDTHVRDTVVFAQSEEFQLADTPVKNPIDNDKEITLQKLIAGLTADKRIIISGKRKRLVIPNQDIIDGKFTFTVTDNTTATRKLRAGDSLIVTEKSKSTGGNTTYFLMDSNGEEGSYVVPDSVINAIKLELSSSEKNDVMVSELHTIDYLKDGKDTTELVIKDTIVNEFDPSATIIYANVAEATHGETRKEVLGSGNGSKKFQKFILKQTPITYISAATATGTETTLEIRVNDILWTEVPTFYGTKPNDKIYTVSINDDGKATVMFGDGITGARLPTGIENVKATYRVGIGLAGSVDADKLSMLLNPPLGVSKVTNPVAASGGEDAETFDTAKANAPLTVLTLDRIVSAKDYEDFTRAFAGIAKAAVEVLWSGEQQVVHITFATEDKSLISTSSALYINLMDAIENASRANQLIKADNYEPISFSVTAGIKAKSEYIFDIVKSEVEQALKDAFSFDAREFGEDVTPAEIIAVIQNVEGVQYADLNFIKLMEPSVINPTVNTDPFTVPGFRLHSERARWQGNTILPAQLLTINESQINITEL